MIEPVITFDKDVYQPGDKVSGKVTLEVTKPLKARSVMINWWGFSRTMGITLTQFSRRSFVLGTEIAWVSKGGEDKIPCGKHEYPFSFSLPKGVPPSYKSLFGKTKYRVKVVIDRPWKLKTKVKKEFTVATTADKEIVKKFRNGVKWFTNYTFNTGIIFSYGPVKLSVYQPQNLYTFGESMDLEYRITNHSNVAVSEIFMDFSSFGHYHARSQLTPCKSPGLSCPLALDQRYNQNTKIGGSKLKCRVEPHSEGTFTLPFVIPEKAKTPTFESGLMTCGYFMEFGFKLENSSVRNKTMPLYRAIGNLPEEKTEEIKTKKQEVSEAVAPPAYQP
ncbi:hypothetical protein CRE_07681 [Caenorhabditis remanei]|uniref:Uncharacterized protein n=1 Tax=Caenorhabditis remanei TaxID=31234 RepID=E3MZV5_CAERE|nr:hypothetical protein CRE_07681 [Caenorhabditis remanei]